MQKDFSKFIVVDGPDGSGKTTIIKHMVDIIKTNSPDVKIVTGRGLGSGKAAESIRSTLLNSEITKSNNYEIYGAIMCLLDCYETFVLPNLNNNNIVILDRYLPSYYAYQVKARKSTHALVMLKDIFNVPFTLHPDLYINCSCSVENSIKRMNGRADNNYLDEENISFKNNILKGYEEFFSNKYLFHTCKPSKVINLNTNPEWPIVYKQLIELINRDIIKND
jgi:dTMP kinase